jgi:hypothetical protein
MSMVLTFGGQGPSPRTILLFGNCQVPFIAHALSTITGLNDDYRFVYAPNHAVPGQPIPHVPQEYLGDVALYVEQYDSRETEVRSALRASVPETCPRVVIPSMFFDCLWPFNCLEPRSFPAEEGFPFGRYPYGDMIGLMLAAKGERGPSAVAAYHQLSMEKMPDLDTRLDRCLNWAAEHDRHSDVRIGDYIEANFRKRQLFWSYGHASAELLLELVRRIYLQFQPIIGGTLENTQSCLAGLSATESMGGAQVPIHPLVAEYYGLAYGGRNQRYRWFDQDWTFDQYIEHYVGAEAWPPAG